MRMFKRPPADESTTYAPAAIDRRSTSTRVATARDTDVATAPPAAAPRAPVARRWHGPTRAFATLVGVALAGLLAYLTTRIGDGTNGGYWAEYGILAGAGLASAGSQLGGGAGDRGQPARGRVDEVGEAALLSVRLPARFRADADRRRLDPRFPPAGRELASLTHSRLVGQSRDRRRRHRHERAADDALL